MFSRIRTKQSTQSVSEQIERLRLALDNADAVVIGAGAGLSASAGFTYDGERFEKYFSDFEKKYGFHDMYSGGFYPFPSEEERWAYWSRNIWINRYQTAPKPVYSNLLRLVRDKDYFVITTNVDHQFQKAGFDKKRLFYTQGDYGLFQCTDVCRQETYDNEEIIRRMVEAQGLVIGEDNTLNVPEGVTLKTAIPIELVPRCGCCGGTVAMNLRCDDTFVEGEGWHKAAERYSNFLRTRAGEKIVFWELGVGYNTPVIIKYPFWKMTAKNPRAIYACVNQGKPVCSEELESRAICIDEDIGIVIDLLTELPLLRSN